MNHIVCAFADRQKRRRQQQQHLQETFVDENRGSKRNRDFRSEFLLNVSGDQANNHAPVRRSASSVTTSVPSASSPSSSRRPAPIAKPVRRSKSQVNGNNRLSVANGPVTFVSVNRSAEDLLAEDVGDPGDFQGAHTLPRAGVAKKNKNR